MKDRAFFVINKIDAANGEDKFTPEQAPDFLLNFLSNGILTTYICNFFFYIGSTHTKGDYTFKRAHLLYICKKGSLGSDASKQDHQLSGTARSEKTLVWQKC